MSGLLLGTAVIAGGAAGVGSYYANKPKKKNLNQGQRVSNEVVGATDLRKRIEGAKIGYGEDYVNRATNVPAQRLQRTFERSTRPMINEEFASRGLGRSSLAARDVGEAKMDTDLNIADLVRQAQLTNLQQGKTDVARQRDELFNLGQAETAQRNRASADETAARRYQIAGEQRFEDLERENINSSIGTGLSVFGSVAGDGGGGAGGGGGLTSMLSQFSSSDATAEKNRRKVGGGTGGGFVSGRSALA